MKTTDKKYTVYCHTFPNGKKYVGITSRKAIKRWSNGTQYKGNIEFTKAVYKYGWDNINHEILFENLSAEQAAKKEIEFIALYQSNNQKYGYNKTIGGFGYLGEPLSDEIKQKLSDKQKARFKLHRDLMTAHDKDINRDSLEIRQVQSAPRKGQFKTAVKVICINTKEIFDSITTAANKHNVDHASIVNACKGQRYSAGGLLWSYVDGNGNYIIPIANRLRKVKCIETGQIFNSAIEVTRKYNHKSASTVINVLRGRALSAYGLHFVYAD